MNSAEKKIFKILIIAVGVIAAGVLVKEIFLTARPLQTDQLNVYILPIQVNFDLLEDTVLEKMILFEDIKMPKQFGRDNPFEPF